MRAIGLRQLRAFSSSAKHNAAAPVRSLGVIGAGQMVSGNAFTGRRM